jgi:hypothetical protein
MGAFLVLMEFLAGTGSITAIFRSENYLSSEIDTTGQYLNFDETSSAESSTASRFRSEGK